MYLAKESGDSAPEREPVQWYPGLSNYRCARKPRRRNRSYHGAYERDQQDRTDTRNDPDIEWRETHHQKHKPNRGPNSEAVD